MAALSVVAVAAQPADPFAACADRFLRTPDDYDAAYCFYEVAQQQKRWDEGARRFEQLIAAHPTNYWLPLAFGHVYRSRDPQRAEALYTRAARDFQAAGHAEGELLARSNLRNFLFPKGRTADATREMERVVAIGNASSDPLLKARAWTLQAAHVQDTGGDLSFAYRLLKQTEAAIFPDGPYRLKRSTLNSLGLVSFRLGRLDDALAVFQKLDEIAGAEGEGLAQATAQYNILNTSSLKESLLPAPGSKARLMALAERSLATAVSAQNRDMTLKTHRALAELLAREPGATPKALGHVESCLELATTLKQPHDEAVCSWVKASLLGGADPRGARAAEARALDATNRANSPRTQAYSARRRMRWSWESRPRAQAIQDSLEAMRSVEALRTLQDDSDATAEQFSTWTSDYLWLSGRLLRDFHGDGDPAARGQPADLEVAFDVTERMRARSLLDVVERSRAPLDAANPVVKERRALLEQIAALQRQLLDSTLAAERRGRALASLASLELAERDARRRLEIALPGRAAADIQAFASLRALRSTLGDDEALLSFQVALWETFEQEFGGGSWLVLLTRQGQAVFRLPDRARLTPLVPMFAGLISRADGRDGPVAARLYDELLKDAIDSLPPSITRLIIVPDGPLHHLPFDALRSRGDGQPLGARYQIVIAPSATLWRHWRSSAAGPPTQRALAFADPDLADGAAGWSASRTAAAERAVALERGVRLGRLPYARLESRALADHLGSVESLIGSHASERALKDRRLQDYDILHFAVHAVADDASPERSAVLLSPGDKTEDGLLQAREIRDLDLAGRVIVLSACQTASGSVLSGEGVLSLGRAFFQAGARSVIGSRWPLRDDEAARLFDAFYRHVGNGASLSEALQVTKAEAIAERRPAAGWASLVLLGDGQFRPFPGGRQKPPARRAWPALAAVALVAAAAFGLSRTLRPAPPA